MTGKDDFFYGMKAKRFLLKRVVPDRLHRFLPRGLTTHALPGCPDRIATRDEMLRRTSRSALETYLAVGQSALDHCEASLLAGGRTFAEVKTCLDLPCGHGRVLRWLARRIDPAGITACDIDREAVDFCRREFGVKGVDSSDDLSQLIFSDSYDLIWVGSLLTHLDSGRCAALLQKLGSALRAGGVLVFTTHGESCFTRPGLPAYGKRFRALADRMRADFRRHGFCHAPYKETGYYGIALHSEKYVRDLVANHVSAPLRLVRFQVRGWHDHQDVWAYQRSNVGVSPTH
ncbi:MAG TPA: class I SAM-dependent methyltransferase [Opitutaceae bacterium]|nr:class I SAM-dependent methyltransferase [Opitutaceae bacterium]